LIFRPVIIPSWVDSVGGMRDSFWTTQDRSEAVPSDLQAVVTAASALTSAGTLAVTFQVPLVVSSSPSANAYNVGDAATFYLTSSTGNNGVISIPAPLSSIFKADGMTIDQTNSNVVSFLSEVASKLGDTNGNPWASVRSASRTRFPG
jgi:hypothetical protein